MDSNKENQTNQVEGGSNQELQNPSAGGEGSTAGTPSQGGVSVVTPILDKKGLKKGGKSEFADLVGDGKGDMSSLDYATKLVDTLSAFVAPKMNVHNDIKLLVTGIQRAMLELHKERDREISLRKKVASSSVVSTPQGTRTKRTRPSPESPKSIPTPKASRGDGGSRQLRKDVGDEEKWEVVGKKGKSKKPAKPKPDKPPRPRSARNVKPKADALLIEAKDSGSYADILRKVKADPSLQDMGSKVARIRRTKNGEMLIELQGDPSVKSEAYRELIEKSLVGSDATVRALTQEAVIEVPHLDEVTTELELREALIDQLPPGDLESTAKVKLRKAYGGTQIATIKLPVAEANKLLELGKIKVGWTICPLRRPRTQLLRCYRCHGFGHVVSKCTVAEDRSKCCWKCGENGHVSKTCSNKPKCMLCQKGVANDHVTGSLRCNAYIKAKANQGWR